MGIDLYSEIASPKDPASILEGFQKVLHLTASSMIPWTTGCTCVFLVHVF